MADPAPIASLVKKSRHGGPRPNSGRKKGSLNKATLEKKIIEDELHQRILKSADRLLNAQMNLAMGEQYLMHKYTTGKGKERKTHVEVVTDMEIIKEFFIDDGVGLNQSNDDNNSFYYISTKPANNYALQSLFERVLGKVMQSIDHTSKGEAVEVGGFVVYRPEKLPNNYDEKMKQPGVINAASPSQPPAPQA